MKKRQIRLAAMMISAMVVLTGCGPTLYEMTDEERDIVVHYAAYVVGKHNIYQKDGMTNADPEDEEEESEELEETQEVPVAEPVNPSTASGTTQEVSTQESEPLKKISLEDALGTADKASVTYQGYKTSDTYQEGNYYSLSAAAGKTFLIMKFKIKNKSPKTLKVDAFSKNSRYAVSLDGAEQIQAEQTFLTYSLTTYQGKIKKGDSVDVVLLFDVPAEQAGKIKDITLTLNQKGVNYLVEL